MRTYVRETYRLERVQAARKEDWPPTGAARRRRAAEMRAARPDRVSRLWPRREHSRTLQALRRGGGQPTAPEATRAAGGRCRWALRGMRVRPMHTQPPL